METAEAVEPGGDVRVGESRPRLRAVPAELQIPEDAADAGCRTPGWIARGGWGR